MAGWLLCVTRWGKQSERDKMVGVGWRGGSGKWENEWVGNQYQWHIHTIYQYLFNSFPVFLNSISFFTCHNPQLYFIRTYGPIQRMSNLPFTPWLFSVLLTRTSSPTQWILSRVGIIYLTQCSSRSFTLAYTIRSALYCISLMFSWWICFCLLTSMPSPSLLHEEWRHLVSMSCTQSVHTQSMWWLQNFWLSWHVFTKVYINICFISKYRPDGTILNKWPVTGKLVLKRMVLGPIFHRNISPPDQNFWK